MASGKDGRTPSRVIAMVMMEMTGGAEGTDGATSSDRGHGMVVVIVTVRWKEKPRVVQLVKVQRHTQ